MKCKRKLKDELRRISALVNMNAITTNQNLVVVICSCIL
jgi:hypothetical protein